MMTGETGKGSLRGDPVELIIDAALGERWIDAFSVAMSAYSSGYVERLDGLEEAVDSLEPELARRVRVCIKDAAATMQYSVPGPDGSEAEAINYLVRLWASMVALNPGTDLTEEDFERIGESLEDATDGDQVVVVPRIVQADDFISASPEALSEILGRMFFDVLDGDGEDPLGELPSSRPIPGEIPVPPEYGVVVGIKISLFRNEPQEIISIRDTHESNPGDVELFRVLLEEAVPSIGHMGFPMAGGSAAVEISRNIALAKAIDFIRRHAADGDLPVTMHADGDILRLAVMNDDGDSEAEAGIDVSGGLWRASDAAEVLKMRLPAIRVAATAEDFWQAASRGVTLN